MKLRPTLIVFARQPALGAVKRRLGRDIGAVAATAFYRHCLAATLRRLAGDPRWRTVLALTPDGAAASGQWPDDVHPVAQGGGDLGQRMARALAAAPPGPAVLVGSDIPGIRRDHIARAFRLLGRRDAVFGPAPDGGYWLVGLRRRPRFIDPFGGVRWSGRHAMADTLANLADKQTAMIDTLEDVDDGSSFDRWRRLSRQGR